MNRETKVKMTKEISVTDLAGEKVMIDFETGKYFMIKGVGNDIWDMIQETITVGEIINKLLEEYEVEEEECSKAVVDFINKLKELCFVELEEV